jgi:hypothetical protein
MNRRDSLLALLASHAPLRAVAQVAGTVYRIGFWEAGRSLHPRHWWKDCGKGCGTWATSRGGAISSISGWGEGRNDRLPELAAELVRANVSVIDDVR